MAETKKVKCGPEGREWMESDGIATPSLWQLFCSLPLELQLTIVEYVVGSASQEHRVSVANGYYNTFPRHADRFDNRTNVAPDIASRVQARVLLKAGFLACQVPHFHSRWFRLTLYAAEFRYAFVHADDAFRCCHMFTYDTMRADELEYDATADSFVVRRDVVRGFVKRVLERYGCISKVLLSLECRVLDESMTVECMHELVQTNNRSRMCSFALWRHASYCVVHRAGQEAQRCHEETHFRAELASSANSMFGFM